MTDLKINTTILTAQASKVDGAAADLGSISLTAPDLDSSTAAVSAAIDRLTSATTSTASSLRSCASSLRATASDFTETDEATARGASSIGTGGE